MNKIEHEYITIIMRQIIVNTIRFVGHEKIRFDIKINVLFIIKEVRIKTIF